MQISKADLCWMDLACRTANTSQCKFLHGAVIVSGGRPIIAVPNIDKLLPVSTRYRHQIRQCYCRDAEKRRERSISTHAEVHAIIKAGCDVRGMTLYSARITRPNERLRRDSLPANSFPCAGCWQIILIAGIDRIVYFDDDGDICKERV